jgi:hypothetical protein
MFLIGLALIALGVLIFVGTFSARGHYGERSVPPALGITAAVIGMALIAGHLFG